MEYLSIMELTNSSHFKDKISKISLIIVFSVLSFIYFFPSQMSQNPMLSNLIGKSNALFGGIWITLLIVIGGYIALSIFTETKSRNRILKFDLESKQDSIFSNFLNEEVAKYNGEFLGSVFTTQDLARFIIETEYSKKNKYISNLINALFNIKVVNELVAMRLSEIILKKAEYKKLIKKQMTFLLCLNHTRS